MDHLSTYLRDASGRVEARVRGWPRTLIAFAWLAAIAFVYYGSFYNRSINLADGGYVALISERLSKGEIPYVDVVIGYGLLWFLPISFIFKIFGVKLFLLQIYFLAIGLASAVLAYLLILGLTAQRMFAFAVALVVLAFPGWTYQPYIPFLVIAGLCALLLYEPTTGKPRIRPCLALLCNGVYLGLAYLIRGEIATVFTVLFLLYHGLLISAAAVDERNPWRLWELPKRALAVSIAIVLVALPFALQAREQGYLQEFLGQYWVFASRLPTKIQQRFLTQESLTIGATAGSLLPRPALSSLILGSDHAGIGRGFAFLTYAPILAVLLIVGTLVIDALSSPANVRTTLELLRDRAALLVLIAGSYSTFPQFFVWRPDIPHLAGFLPGFAILMGYWLFWLRTGREAPRIHSVARQVVFYLSCALCALYLILFEVYSEDGLKLRPGRFFQLNLGKGIDLRLNREEFQDISQMVSIVKEFSEPGEFVLCFPFCPGINFIADRPTFQRNLYVDDSFLILKPAWLDEMRSEIASRQPKVVIIEDWAINTTEISRFRNWANPLYLDIMQSFELKAEIRRYKIFVRR